MQSIFTLKSLQANKKELTLNYNYGLTIKIRICFGLFSHITFSQNDNIIEVTCMHFFKFKSPRYYYDKKYYDKVILFGAKKLKTLE